MNFEQSPYKRVIFYTVGSASTLIGLGFGSGNLYLAGLGAIAILVTWVLPVTFKGRTQHLDLVYFANIINCGVIAALAFNSVRIQLALASGTANIKYDLVLRPFNFCRFWSCFFAI